MLLSYVEISDCHGKVRIHKADRDSTEEFALKIELLRDTLSEFAQYLRDTSSPHHEKQGVSHD